MKRSTFRTSRTVPPVVDPEQRAEQRQSRMKERLDGMRVCGGTYAGETAGPVPKTEAKRCPALLEMARDRPCMLLAVAHCQGPGMRSETTVACHRNEGKGMALKQSDEYSVWGCAACHDWYDRSGAPRAEKRRAFMAAHLRQVQAWRVIASDPSEPERFRKAAAWALSTLNATPTGALE